MTDRDGARAAQQARLLRQFEGRTACCFTGHRPSGLPGADTAAMTLLRLQLMNAVTAAAQGGVRRFLAGGARGFDTLAAEAVLFLRRREALPLTLTLALPSPRQADGWPDADRSRYEAVLAGADEVFYADERNGALAMKTRNRYLVEHADCCIAYLCKRTGGTLYTVNYALERGLFVYNLAEHVRA